MIIEITKILYPRYREYKIKSINQADYFVKKKKIRFSTGKTR